MDVRILPRNHEGPGNHALDEPAHHHMQSLFRQNKLWQKAGDVMPKIAYITQRFSRASKRIINQANAILKEYSRQGYTLTLRQLYYQFITRNVFANTEANYKRLGKIVSDGRLAGLIDWAHVIDRTRFLRALPHWSCPEHIIQSAAESYHIDLWQGQKYRPEIWIEKDALVDIACKAGDPLDVPVFSCRGYPSQSEMWQAAQRLLATQNSGQYPVILHFGDHDPSGTDMSRDITDRLILFGVDVIFERIALNMDQIEEFHPPPNFAKSSDSRYNAYCNEYGNESWELDAIEPRTLTQLMTCAIRNYLDASLFEKQKRVRAEHRAQLNFLAQHFNRIQWGIKEGES